ncbi:hypothetical protein ACROYT_G015778 [Oculina patagonica]
MKQGVQVVLEEYQTNFSSLFSNLNITDDLMSRAIQAGNPTRLKNVLEKALRGEDINLLVIGGSHSAGGKLGLDENSLDGLYFKVFAKWWNNTFGRATTSFMREIQLAIGATGSQFFAFCYKTFIAEGEKIDIVLIETSHNDEVYKTAKPLEQLTRQVLMYPSAPAVLYINIVGRLGSNSSCINLENYGQTAVARHYDITSFSLKEILCRKEKEVVNNYTNVSKDPFNQVTKNKSSNLPKLLLINETEALKDPLCWTGKTPNAFKNLHRPNLQLEVINNSSFSPCFIVRAQPMNVKIISKELRPDTQGGWCAWQRLSTLQLKIYVPVSVDANFGRSRSVIVLIGRHMKGRASIWLDNKKNETVNTSKSSWSEDRYHTIATRVNPGYHTITVNTSRDGMFMVAGVFVGAPDFQSI